MILCEAHFFANSSYHIVSAFKSWNLLLFLRGLIPSNSGAALLFCTEVRKFDLYAHERPVERRKYLEISEATPSIRTFVNVFQL
jgi:hypothetical protein